MTLTACAAPREPGRGGSAVTVTDQRGRTVSLPGPAQRVVTLPMPAASMLICLDRSVQHLAGMHHSSWTAARESVLGQMFPEVAGIPHEVADANFAPNVEAITALAPDVVVQWGDEGPGIVAPLENAGLPVVGLSYGTQEDLTTWIGLFGALLGNQDRAHALRSWMDTRLGEVRQAAATAGTRPKIVYFNRFRGGLKVAGSGTYNDFSIGLVGGANPATAVQGMAGVDVEQVLAWDPDIVLLGNFDGAVPQDVYADPVWATTSAVRSRRVYKVPLGGYRWDPPGQESPLMWQWLFLLAHPEAAPSDLRGRITEDYRFLYGHQPSPAQVDAILRLDVNGAAPDYRRFDAG